MHDAGPFKVRAAGYALVMHRPCARRPKSGNNASLLSDIGAANPLRLLNIPARGRRLAGMKQMLSLLALAA
ncbi:hypothetical protein AB9K41_09915, partial [Cribrihabitans sp. XS_ASV171]